jgi:hypothetical protein
MMNNRGSDHRCPSLAELVLLVALEAPMVLVVESILSLVPGIPVLVASV